MKDIFSVSSSALPPETRVLAFTGAEGLSRTYAFELHLLVPEEGAELDMGAAINARASLLLHPADGTPRATYHGVLSSLELLHELPGEALYRAVLVPQLWQLKLSIHSNVFVNQSIPEIIEGILEDSGLSGEDYELRLEKTYKAREHVCQYRESNFDFISRWLEREGMYYFFEQGEEREKLIITDTRSAHAPLGAEPIRYSPVAVHAATGPVEALNAFTCRYTSLPASVSIKDYDYLKPTLDVSGEAPVVAGGVGEVYSFGDNAASPEEAKRLARVRAEELLSRRVLYQGHGCTFDLRPGYTFQLEEHPRAAFNAEYQVLELTHRGSNAGGSPEARSLLGADEGGAYRVDVTAIPASVQFRPQRVTPTPRIYGVETAVVDGEADSEYAQIDEHGRYSLKVMFDENDLRNGKASTRVRMLQPHGGELEGMHFPLRKGTEVLLLFLGGDPDRPVITGVAPNALRPSPVVADNHTMNVIRTGGDNRIEIQDSAGEQYVKITTPHEETMLHLGAPHNPTHHVQLQTKGKAKFKFGKDWNIEVGGQKTEHVVKDVTENYDAKQTAHVKGAVKEDYDSGQTTTVTGDQKSTVTGAVTEEYGSQTTHVKGKVKEDYDSGQTTTILAGGQTHTITGDQQTTLTGNRTETITGTCTQTIAQGLTINSPVTVTINAPSVTINAAGGHTVINPGAHSEVHGFWDKTAGMAKEAVGFKFGVYGAKIDMCGLAMSVQPVKFDNSLFKIDNYAVKVDNGKISFSPGVGVKMRNAAIGLYMYGLVLFS